MESETRTTDGKGRLSLNKAFANATVIVEYLSDTEVRIRKALVVPESEFRFREESQVTLSDRDRDRFLDLLDNPPEANNSLRAAAAKRKKPRG